VAGEWNAAGEGARGTSQGAPRGATRGAPRRSPGKAVGPPQGVTAVWGPRGERGAPRGSLSGTSGPATARCGPYPGTGHSRVAGAPAGALLAGWGGGALSSAGLGVLAVSVGSECDTDSVSSLRDQASALRGGVSLGHRAAELGHLVQIERDGKRFRIACECGFKTSRSSTRKAAFAQALEHTAGVVKNAS
jgi:hypothetical protein